MGVLFSQLERLPKGVMNVLVRAAYTMAATIAALGVHSGIRDGQILWGRRAIVPVVRAESPASYWASIGAVALVGALCFRQAFRPGRRRKSEDPGD